MSSKEQIFKRPFQSSIDSYLTHLSQDHPSAPTQCSTASPQLPTYIQSSLLNVGMRVRKAVSEGYKTKSLLEPANPEACHQSSARGQVQGNRYRGLMPYCGILKVGGYEARTKPDKADLPTLGFDDRTCSSNQESNGTDAGAMAVECSPYATNKRRHSEEDHGDENGSFQLLSEESRYSGSHTKMPNLNALRVIANPRTRKIQQGGISKIWIDENVNMTSAGDFEEADLFRAEEWASPDMEF